MGDENPVGVAQTRGPQTVLEAQNVGDTLSTAVPRAPAAQAAAKAQKVQTHRAKNSFRPEKRQTDVGRARLRKDVGRRSHDQKVRCRRV